MANRVSLRSELKLEGTGIHSGNKVRLKIIPAPFHTGIIFRNAHKAKEEILLSPFSVIDTLNAVTLGSGSWQVQTVEHLLAALYSARITDAIVELDSVEMPIMDGSAYPFYEAIQQTGVLSGGERIEPIHINTAIWIVQRDKFVMAIPQEKGQENLSIHYSIDYDHPLLRNQNFFIECDKEDSIAQNILPARTFGFLRDIEKMQAQNLIKGASLENAVVLTNDGYKGSLRFQNECIRHKILDLLGDLYLLGRPLSCHLIASKAGHAIDVALAKMIWKHCKSQTF